MSVLSFHIGEIHYDSNWDFRAKTILKLGWNDQGCSPQ